MFADQRTLLDGKRPINNFRGRTVQVITERSIIEELNEKILLRHVYFALDDRKMLSNHWVSEEKAEETGEKSYSVQIYGEDLAFRYKKQVMFANREDVQKLFKLLREAVGEERMHICKYSINSNEPDDLNRIGMEMRKKWKENWPI